MINDLIGKNIADKYRIDSLIRETELGDFYRGTNTGTGVPVTVKILAPAMAIDVRYVERFLAEANAAAVVSHRNILNSIDVGSDTKGLPFAIYEGIEGETLEDTLKLYGPMAEPRAIGIAKQIAAAFAATHLNGTVHGGLNPSKVIINTLDGLDSVKIYDFGVRGHARNSMTAVPFLAPEQTRETSNTDTRSDIYSLGTLLYDMIAGEPPFTAATPAAIIQKANNEPPAPLSAFRQDLHPQLEPIILSAIAPDPERRYQTIVDFEEDLGRLASETGAEIPSVAVVAAASAANEGAKRNVWQTAFVVLAGIFVLGGAMIYATYSRQTNPTTVAPTDANSTPVQPINPATGAQEEAMLRMGDLGDASLLPNSPTGAATDNLPGGDGFNAWANGGVPPAGAPLTSGTSNGNAIPNGNQNPPFVPPAGPTVTVNPNGGSIFMPNEGGVILVPIPANTEPVVKPSPTPKNSAANVQVKPGTDPKTTPATNPGGTKVDAGKSPNKQVKTSSTPKPAKTNGPAAEMSPSL
jgi:hypothetical protein